MCMEGIQDSLQAYVRDALTRKRNANDEKLNLRVTDVLCRLNQSNIIQVSVRFIRAMNYEP